MISGFDAEDSDSLVSIPVKNICLHSNSLVSYDHKLSYTYSTTVCYCAHNSKEKEKQCEFVSFWIALLEMLKAAMCRFQTTPSNTFFKTPLSAINL